MHNTEIQKNKSRRLIKQAGGMITKIESQIEADRYCPEIIQQMSAAIGLLESAKKELLIGHLDRCLEHKMKEDKQKTIQELIDIFKLTK